MAVQINRELFEASIFDSGALGPLAMVVHECATEGMYVAKVTRNGQVVGTEEFRVSAKSEVKQLNIDLAQFGKKKEGDCECEGVPEHVGAVAPNGYLLLHASTGRGYAANVTNDKGEVVFDSTRLSEGDLFAVSLLEPTTYLLANKLGSATGDIQVNLPDDLHRRRAGLKTLEVSASQKKFDPTHIEVASTQGIVFRIKDAARIVIEKQKGRLERQRLQVRWRPPGPTKQR